MQDVADQELALEARWFYDPDRDEDRERAGVVSSMMRRPGKRSETKKAKQNAVSNKAGGCRRLRLVSLSCPWLSQGLGYGSCSCSPGSSSALGLMSKLMW